MLLLAFGAISCERTGDEQNKYLSSIPALALDFKTRISEMEKRADESTDLAEAYNYAATAKLLRKEADAELYAAYAGMQRPVLLPVEQSTLLNNCPIHNVEIVSVCLDSIVLTAEVKIIDDCCPGNSFCLCGIDNAESRIIPHVVFEKDDAGSDHTLRFCGVIKNPENYIEFSRFLMVDTVKH